MKTIYDQLESKVLPIMTAYHADLTMHDRNKINENADISFLHFADPMHTYIIFLNESDSYPPIGEKVPYLFGYVDRYHILEQKVIMTEYWRDNKVTLVHYFDGYKLRQITSEDAIEIITKYADKIKREWRS